MLILLNSLTNLYGIAYYIKNPRYNYLNFTDVVVLYNCYAI